MLQSWQPEPEESMPAEVQVERPVTPPNQAEVLAKTSEALQSLFFGVDTSPRRTVEKAFVPAAAAAAKSPKSQSLPRFGSPKSQTSETAPMQSPKPAYPASDHRADSLLRLLQQSAMKAAQSASPSAQLPSGNAKDLLEALLPESQRNSIITSTQPSTIQARSPATLIPSAPGSDLRNSHNTVAVSPVYPVHIDQLTLGQPNLQRASLPAPVPYTEDEREEARHAILASLASQLGTGPTPPSPEGSGSEYGSREGEDDEPDLDCASPVQDLVEIFRTQLLEDGQNRQMGELKMTNAVMRDLEERHAVKRAREEQLVNEARARMGLQQTYQHTLSQSRSQILQVLQGAGQPQLTNGSSPSRQVQQEAMPVLQQQSALLGLLNTAQPVVPSATETLSPPDTAHTLLRSSHGSRQSPTDLLRASQTSRHNAPPSPAGPRSPNIPPSSNGNADKSATLLGLLQAKSQPSLRPREPVQDPRQYIPQDQPILPDTFANGVRRQEFHNFVSQDQQLAEMENRLRRESAAAAHVQMQQQNSQIRHVRSLAALLQHGASMPTALPDFSRPQQLPQPYAANGAYNASAQPAQAQSNDLLKLFAAAQNPLVRGA